MADYLPTRDGDMVTWLKNFSSKLATHAKTLSMNDTQLKAEQKRCDDLIAAIQLNEQKRAEYQATVSSTNRIKEESTTALRALARWIKANSMYSDAIGQDMQIVGGTTQAMLDEIKPELKVEAHKGFIRIAFKKGKLDGVNVYRRFQGESNWQFVARDTHSPYDDHTSLKQPGVTETREYYVHGVIKDEEVGTASDIVSVVVTL